MDNKLPNFVKEYTFKKAYNTPSGSTFYVGEKYPEHYLLQKVPLLFKNIILKDEYLVLSSKVSLEDTTKEPITIGENKTKTLSTFELKEKEDITDTTIYINEISLEDLIKIQGIGDKAANKLITARKDKRFESITELTKIASTVKWDKYIIIY